MRILHLLSVNKFLPQLLEVCEAANPGQNRYSVQQASTEMVSCIPEGHSFILREGKFSDLNLVRGDLEWCEAIFVHYVTEESAAMVGMAGEDKAIVWCGFGADYYDYSLRYRDSMLLGKTDAAFSDHALPVALSRIRPLWFSLQLAGIIRKRIVPGWMRDFADRVDFFCPYERDLRIDKVIAGFTPVQLPGFPYYSIDLFALGPQEMRGPDILLGNSATATNNHLDAFDDIRRIDLSGRKIVLPLSYGDEGYAQIIADKAISVFGRDRLILLRHWMPIEDYNRVIESCGVVVMNHVRGQAMGNICAALYKGAKVFLRPENPYFRGLKNDGAHIFPFKREGLSAALNEPLSSGERRENAAVIQNEWSRESVEKKARRTFETVGGLVRERTK